MATLTALTLANPGWHLTMRSCGFKQSTLQCLVRQGMYSFSVKRDFDEMTSTDDDGAVYLDEDKVKSFGEEIQENIDKAEEKAQADMEARAEAEEAAAQKAAEEAELAEANEGIDANESQGTDDPGMLASINTPDTTATTDTSVTNPLDPSLAPSVDNDSVTVVEAANIGSVSEDI